MLGSVLSKTRQAGFTLVELVIVIVILAILASIALPRFVSLGADARKASVDGMYGSVIAAANLAHSLYLVTGGNPSSVTMEGTSVALTNGYPSHAAGGIENAVRDTSGFTSVAGTGSWDFRVTSAGTPTSCMVTYVAPTASGLAPTVTATKTDCS